MAAELIGSLASADEQADPSPARPTQAPVRF